MDISKYFQLPRIMLILSGTWPQKSPFQKYFQKGYLLTEFLIVSLSVKACFSLIYDLNTFFKKLVLVSSLVMTTVKGWVFLGNGKHVLELYEYLNDPHFINVPQHLEKHMIDTMDITKKTMQWFLTVIFVLLCLINILPFLTDDGVMFIPITLFGHFKWFMMVMQILNVDDIGLKTFGLDMLFVYATCVIKAQLCILSGKIRFIGSEYQDSENGKSAETSLTDCVVHHYKIARLTELTQTIFSFVLFVQYIESVITVCTVGFQLLTTSLFSLDFLVMSLYCNAALFQLVVYCWFGNEIIVYSADISNACYDCNWLNMSTTARNMLFLIMERSKRPFYLTAGNFFTLSLQSLTSVRIEHCPVSINNK
ncbi:hypothetical protein ABEB36_002338 [Hypothenemus hampei]|uniref:Odorant receptor n=1 Tax=Hypothenemus hampei TaxID=57062 RepID=A0ABD1F5G2_HYPHA